MSSDAFEQVHTVLFSVWNPQCRAPGCTLEATIVCTALLVDGTDRTKSLCEDHARAHQRALVEQLDFVTNGVTFTNVRALMRALPALKRFDEKVEQAREEVRRDREEPGS